MTSHSWIMGSWGKVSWKNPFWKRLFSLRKGYVKRSFLSPPPRTQLYTDMLWELHQASAPQGWKPAREGRPLRQALENGQGLGSCYIIWLLRHPQNNLLQTSCYVRYKCSYCFSQFSLVYSVTWRNPPNWSINSFQTLYRTFHGIWGALLKFIWKGNKPRISKPVLKDKKTEDPSYQISKHIIKS